jgi:hypothetical protein
MTMTKVTTDKDGNKLGGKVEEYQGEKLNPPIEYFYEFTKYDNVAEAKASEDWLNDNDILKIVNQTAERTAKASAYQKAVADKKKEYEKSDAYTRKEMVKLLVLRGKSQEEAEKIAASM